MDKLFRILSIDGGGVRGVLSGEILVALEEKIQQNSGNSSARIADYFDMISGNSTGGILTCLYLAPNKTNPIRPLYSAEDAVAIYMEHGQEIFKDEIRQKLILKGGLTNEKYPSLPFESLLEKYFHEIKLSEMLRPCIIPAYNITKRCTHFFTQQDAKESPDYDFYLKDVARASSAAPTYFEPALVSSLANNVFPLVDGGVFANNPSLCAFSEASHKFKNINGFQKITARDIFLVSIGTGLEKRSLEFDTVKGWGALGWIFPVLDIVLSGATDTVDFQLEQIFDSFECSENYIRINPKLGNAKPEMDNASKTNLEALKVAGKNSADLNNEVLESIAKKIVDGGISTF